MGAERHYRQAMPAWSIPLGAANVRRARTTSRYSTTASATPVTLARRSRGSKTLRPNGDRYSTAMSIDSVNADQSAKSTSAAFRAHADGRTRIENGKQNPTIRFGDDARTRTSRAG